MVAQTQKCSVADLSNSGDKVGPSASTVAHEERAASQLPAQSRLSAFRLNRQETSGAEDLSDGTLRIARQSAGLSPNFKAWSGGRHGEALLTAAGLATVVLTKRLLQI